MKPVLIGIATACLAGSSAPTSPAETRRALMVSIERPAPPAGSGASVEVFQDVSGRVSDPKASVWLVIQPRESPSDCWVQPQAAVDSNGVWHVPAQFGEDTPAHTGKRYLVRAVANPREDLRQGKRPCWPAAEAASNLLNAYRR